MHRHNTLIFSTYIIGGDSACRISGYKLELHINLAKEILVFGLKPRARGFVKGKSEKIAVVEYLGTTISPCYVKILVEVAMEEANNTNA